MQEDGLHVIIRGVWDGEDDFRIEEEEIESLVDDYTFMGRMGVLRWVWEHKMNKVYPSNGVYLIAAEMTNSLKERMDEYYDSVRNRS